MKIDVHAHLYPPEYIKAVGRLCAGLIASGSWRGPVAQAIKLGAGGLHTAEDMLAEMDAAGVDMQVLSLSIPSVYFEDSKTSHYLSQVANDAFAEVVQKYPDRFMALATIPLEFPDLAVEEMHRAIEELGMKGLVVGGNVRGKPLNSPEFLPVFEEADRLNLTVSIHPMIPVGAEAYREYGMTSGIGYLVDSTVAATRLVYSGLFEKCRNLKMIIPHMGGMIPFNIQRLDHSYEGSQELQEKIPHPPSAYFKKFYYDDANYHVPALRCGYETFGATQMLMGSDFPFRSVKSGEFIQNIRALGLSEAEEDMIFSGNALRIFKNEHKMKEEA